MPHTARRQYHFGLLASHCPLTRCKIPPNLTALWSPSLFDTVYPEGPLQAPPPIHVNLASCLPGLHAADNTGATPMMLALRNACMAAVTWCVALDAVALLCCIHWPSVRHQHVRAACSRGHLHVCMLDACAPPGAPITSMSGHHQAAV